MNSPTLNELKKELSSLPASELLNVCLRLAKYKKENKELLGYLLFDSNYEPEFIDKIKSETDLLFSEINSSTLYFAKKGLRKILRLINRYARYSGQKRTEVELRLHYCMKLKNSGLPLSPGTALSKIYEGQILKISKAVSALHDDLQHDYTEEMKRI